MVFHLNKNAILIGHVDLFCLVCERHVNDEKEALIHLTESTHLKNLQSAPIIEKFKDDNILKVKNGYYCMFCNAVFATGTKVSLHVAGTGHKCKKGSQLLRREDGAIVFQDLLLEENAWHGIVGEMCAVCNVDFEEHSDQHKKTPTHLFNLVKNTVDFGLKTEIYRKIDDTVYQCITCNIIFLSHDLLTHFKDSDHMDEVLKKSKDYIEFKNRQTNQNVGNVWESNANTADENDKSGYTSTDETNSESFDDALETIYDNKEDMANILDSITIFEKNEVNINFISETAFCKKCFGNVDFDYKTVEDHINEHKENPKKRNVGYKPFQCEVNMKVKGKSSPLPGDDKSQISPNYAVKTDAKVKINCEPLNIIKMTDKITEINENDNEIKNKHDRNETEVSANTQSNAKKINIGYTPFQCDVNMKVKSSSLPGKTDEVEKNSEPLKIIEITDDITELDENDNTIKYNHNMEETEVFADTQSEPAKEEDPVDFAKSNHLTYNKGNNNAYCRLCERKLPSTLKSMKEHVSGKSHVKNLNASVNQESIPKFANSLPPKMRMGDYIYDDVTIQESGDKLKVINDKFCIKLSSYHMITLLVNNYRCHVCETGFFNYEHTRHMESCVHTQQLYNTSVITKYKDEFVREVRPNWFHCGFCQLIILSELKLGLHFSSVEHKKSKKYYERKLITSRLLIREHRLHREDIMRRQFERAVFGHRF